jgi:diguanylate cyclase (GGDEF)-like protein
MVKDEMQMQKLAEKDPIWAGHMLSNNVCSVVLFPLKSGKETIGYLYVVNYDTDRAVEVKEMLQLMAFILGSEIAGFQMRERLEWLSSRDELTGLQNRNAMWRKMETMEEAGLWPLGVVNMDLNGLKRTNDMYGHDAGDRLIQDTAGFIKQIFPIETLYRPGGDEFLAILSGTSEEEFTSKVHQLLTVREKEPAFNVAIGAAWQEDESMDMNQVFKLADQRMYDDKRDFYKQHPDEDRRHLLER